MEGWKKVMSELEKQEFERIISAMSEEEMKLAAERIAKKDEDILWNALRKQATANRNTLKAVRDMVAVEL